ncbi:MAG: TIGR02300 family protein [Aquamicrobium sp.]|nr:TIGR02300 family protein [Aquamicrobium sp.]
MAKPDLGTKRICPETGRKFYDLNKDPIVSPYTGQSYPLSYFESGTSSISDDEEVEEKELDAEESGAEIVSLEDADDEAKGDSDDVSVDDEEDVDLGDDDDDTFLAEEEEDEDDVSGIISVGDDDDES